MFGSVGSVKSTKKTLSALAYDVSRLEHFLYPDILLVTSYNILRHSKTLDPDTATAIRSLLLYFRTLRHTSFPKSTWKAFQEVTYHLDRWMDEIICRQTDKDTVSQMIKIPYNKKAR